MVLTEASSANRILLLGRIRLDIQAQICSCALFQLAYDNQLDRVPEFISSTEKILVPGGSWSLSGKRRDRPSLYLPFNKEIDFSFLVDVPVLLTIAIYTKQTEYRKSAVG